MIDMSASESTNYGYSERELKDMELQANLKALVKEEKMTREEHLKWCKERALVYVDSGNMGEAFSSMASDLKKHPETEMHSGIQLGMMLLMGGHLSTPEQMRKFIEGFN